jgi:hypothetical protein
LRDKVSTIASTFSSKPDKPQSPSTVTRTTINDKDGSFVGFAKWHPPEPALLADAVKAAYDRDPAGDPARQARVKEVLERYKDVGKMTNGPAILDIICKENDELTMIYK